MAAAAALAGTARASIAALAAVVFVLQLALAHGWARALCPPGHDYVSASSRARRSATGRRGRVPYGPLAPAWVGVATAAATDAVLVARLAAGPLASPLLGMGAAQQGLALVLASIVPAAIAQQLLRGASGAAALSPLAAAATGAVLAVLASHWIIAGANASGTMTVALAAVCAGSAVTAAQHMLAWRPAVAAALIVCCAAPLGAGIGSLSPFFGATRGAVLGFAAGLVASAGFAASSYVRARWDDSVVLAAALPLATVGPAANMLGRILPGMS